MEHQRNPGTASLALNAAQVISVPRVAAEARKRNYGTRENRERPGLVLDRMQVAPLSRLPPADGGP
jgi:hypothetical protein